MTSSARGTLAQPPTRPLYPQLSSTGETRGSLTVPRKPLCRAEMHSNQNFSALFRLPWFRALPILGTELPLKAMMVILRIPRGRCRWGAEGAADTLCEGMK